MNDISNVELYKQAAASFDAQLQALPRLAMQIGPGDYVKRAYAPMQPPAGPAMAPPPGDPNAMPPGPPPGDPNAMPPGPPPGDPNAMPPGPPPGDPGAGAPPQGGGLPPELESVLGDLANGVQGMAQTQEQQQGALDQLSKRLLVMEKQIGDLDKALKGPSPVEDNEEPGMAGAGMEGPSPDGPAPEPPPVA